MNASTKRTWCKQDVLHEALLGMARNLGPERRMPTIQELCSSLRVSTSTLNPVLQQLETEGAIIRRHGHGIFVSPTIHQKTIGVVVGSDIYAPGFSPLWQLLIEAARAEANGREHRYQSYMDIPQGKEGFADHSHLMRDLREKRVHGVFLISARDAGEIESLKQTGLPLVIFGTKRGVTVPNVTLDDQAGARAGVAELAAAGARRFGYFGCIDPKTASSQNFVDAIQQLPASASSELFPLYQPLPVRPKPDATREEWGFAQMRALLQSPKHPDGFWIEDDTITRGALMAIHQAGLQIGRDVWIATSAHKGSPVLAPYETELILVEFDPVVVVQTAFDILEQLMTGRRLANDTVLIAPVVRKPVAPTAA